MAINKKQVAGNNTPVYLALAHNAAKAWGESVKGAAKGDALAIVACVQAFDTFEMSWKLDDQHKPVAFTLKDMERGLFTEKGTNDTKAISARLTAVATQLFGLPLGEDVPAAFKASLNRALSSVRMLVREGVVPTIDANGFLCVPLRFVQAAPKDNASAKEKMLYEHGKNTFCPLDGRDGMTMKALHVAGVEADKQVGINKKSRKPRVKVDPGHSVMDTVEAASKYLLALAGNPGDIVAIGEARRATLKAMATKMLVALEKEAKAQQAETKAA